MPPVLIRATAWSGSLTKLSSRQAGTLGELLTMAKLNTLGHAAYISPRGRRASPDVIVVVAGQRKSNEVKTRQFVDRIAEITRWPVDMETKGDADFFIFIELDLRSLSPAFLLTNAQARETHKNYMGSGNWSRRMYRVERRESARRC